MSSRQNKRAGAGFKRLCRSH